MMNSLVKDKPLCNVVVKITSIMIIYEPCIIMLLVGESSGLPTRPTKCGKRCLE